MSQFHKCIDSFPLQVFYKYSYLYCLLQDDYTHLLRVLSTRYFKARKNKSWELTDVMKKEIAEIVAQVLAKCFVYSQESDIDLDLTCKSDQLQCRQCTTLSIHVCILSCKYHQFTSFAYFFIITFAYPHTARDSCHYSLLCDRSIHQCVHVSIQFCEVKG